MLDQNKPRHEQISNWIRNRIESGEVKAQDKLPSEKQLGNKFDVSRVTVRHALQTLENEGLIYRRQGLGSFVSNKKIEQPMAYLHDFVEEMNAAGLTASSKIISFEKTPATKKLITLLSLQPDASLLRLERVRFGDDKPIAFDQTWLPVLYGQLLDGHNLEERTIYQILEDEYEIPILSGRYQISAENAAPGISKHLDIKEGAALLMIDRLSCTIGQKKVYYQRRYLRPDRISYELFLERPFGDEKDRSTQSQFPIKEFLPVFNK